MLTDEQQQILTVHREAFIARTAHDRVLADARFGTLHADEMTFVDLDEFLQTVWAAEGRAEKLMVTRVDESPPSIQVDHFGNAAASAQWFTVPDWHDGVRSTDQRRLMTYIDAWDRGLNRLTAIHELAHLLCDTESNHIGHTAVWSERVYELLGRHVSRGMAVLWPVEFDWWTEKAAEKIAADLLWLADLG